MFKLHFKTEGNTFRCLATRMIHMILLFLKKKIDCSTRKVQLQRIIAQNNMKIPILIKHLS